MTVTEIPNGVKQLQAIYIYKSVPFKKNVAIPKKIINAVTSTKVATKGAEEVAGSSPTFFNRKGNNEPESVPHRTIPTIENPTVKPINIQCAP